LKRAEGRVVLREIRGEQFVSLTGGELLEQVQRMRGYLRRSGLHRAIAVHFSHPIPSVGPRLT